MVRRVRDVRRGEEWRKTRRRVRVDSLVPTQASVNERYVQDLAAGRVHWSGPVHVEETGGSLLIWDGHHRAAATRLRRQRYVTADVFRKVRKKGTRR